MLVIRIATPECRNVDSIRFSTESLGLVSRHALNSKKLSSTPMLRHRKGMTEQMSTNTTSRRSNKPTAEIIAISVETTPAMPRSGFDIVQSMNS